MAVAARFPIVTDGGYLSPGSCFLCRRDGSTDPLGMTDTMQEMEGLAGVDSTVYLCSFCVNEMAHQYGCTTPDETAKVAVLIAEMDVTIRDLLAHINKMGSILDGYGALNSFSSSNPVPRSHLNALIYDNLSTLRIAADRSAGLLKRHVEDDERVIGQLSLDSGPGIESESRIIGISDESRSDDLHDIDDGTLSF